MLIYHNPRCSKSRQTLALLEESGVSFEVVLYLNGLDDRFDATFARIPDLPTLLRKDAKPEGDLLTWLKANPAGLERPIVANGEVALVCRPPELVHTLLG